jgi:hypothetical protein
MRGREDERLKKKTCRNLGSKYLLAKKLGS